MSREPAVVMAQRRRLGTSLATFRQAAQLSQSELGKQTHYDRTSINKIEHGQQLPDRPFWQTADRLLRADGAILKRYDEVIASKREHAQQQRQSSQAHHQADAERLRRDQIVTSALPSSAMAKEPADDPERDPVLAAPWSHRGTVEASVVLSGGKGRVERRRFVSLTGAVLTAPAHQWLVREPGPLISAWGGGRVSTRLADRLPVMIAELRRIDDLAGGGAVFWLAQHGFEWVSGLLDRASYDEPTGRKLHVALAELGQLAGWAAYDAGQPGLAQRYHVAALHAAHSAADRPLGAHILGCMADQAAREERPAEAVTLIETALLGARGRETPRLLAELYIRQAYALAVLQDVSACTAAVSKARMQVEGLMPDTDPLWLYWVSPAEIIAGAGDCLLQLGQADRATALLDEGVALFDEAFARDRQV